MTIITSPSSPGVEVCVKSRLDVSVMIKSSISSRKAFMQFANGPLAFGPGGFESWLTEKATSRTKYVSSCSTKVSTMDWLTGPWSRRCMVPKNSFANAML